MEIPCQDKILLLLLLLLGIEHTIEYIEHANELFPKIKLLAILTGQFFLTVSAKIR